MPTEKAAESRFWDRYIEILKQAKVPEPAHRWYVIRVERYIAAHSTLRLRLHTPSTLDAYLTEAGRDTSLPGWRFRQLAHALQLLFTQLLKLAWAQQFDWEYWLASAQELAKHHPTVVRHNSPIAVTPPPAAHDVPAESDWRERLIAEIRRRHYSIRTEEAYVNWVRRYLRFNRGAQPGQLSAEHVAAYLWNASGYASRMWTRITRRSSCAMARAVRIAWCRCPRRVRRLSRHTFITC